MDVSGGNVPANASQSHAAFVSPSGSHVAGLAMSKRGLSVHSVASAPSLAPTPQQQRRPTQILLGFAPIANDPPSAPSSPPHRQPQPQTQRMAHLGHPGRPVQQHRIPTIRKHSLDSKTTLPPTSSKSASPTCPSDRLFHTCDSLAFTCQSIASTLDRCLPPHDAASSSVAPILQSLHSASMQLDAAVQRQKGQDAPWSKADPSGSTPPHSPSSAPYSATSSPPPAASLSSLASRCVLLLMEICRQVQSKLPMFASSLDRKRLRQLILTVHGATLDIKETCLALQASSAIVADDEPWLPTKSDTDASSLPPVPPPSSGSSSNAKPAGSPSPPLVSATPSASSSGTSPTTAVPALPGISAISSKSTSTTTSHHRHTRSSSSSSSSPPPTQNAPGSSPQSPLTSPFSPSSPLMHQLQLALTASIHLNNVLTEAIQQLRDGASSSGTLKLDALHTQTQLALQSSHQLQISLQSTRDPAVATSLLHQQCIFEQVHGFLKLFVALLSEIRSLSTEEDVVWPKAIKQGCLNMTRITAEVAKHPFIAQHSFGPAPQSSPTSTQQPT
ncbi:hypothetical protein DM01DRAFT_1157666 [Hesseltinella vesiculosa]|uniref:Uncharacterized protein n=1 Tax=Hesseltinella vesiculosa TaxID=101127 RepID=A0A1X2GTH6_9FUNG|nr:hypothetical protein DM01DRAFT_1157666 [Hesseltinella vesiculosa]